MYSIIRLLTISLYFVHSLPSKRIFSKCANIVDDLYEWARRNDTITDVFFRNNNIEDGVSLRGIQNILGFSDDNLFGIVGALVGEGPKEGIICFRGTIGMEDWLNNIDYDQVPISKYIVNTKDDIYVSSGFSEIYFNRAEKTISDCTCLGPCIGNPRWCYTNEECGMEGIVSRWDYCSQDTQEPRYTSIELQIEEWVRKYPDIEKFYVCGHSLGAALGTLASFHILQLGRYVDSLYLFASPRVGNIEFSNYFVKFVNAYLFYIDGDIVPTLPLSYSKVNNECYKHVSYPHYVGNYDKNVSCSTNIYRIYHSAYTETDIWFSQFEFSD